MTIALLSQMQIQLLLLDHFSGENAERISKEFYKLHSTLASLYLYPRCSTLNNVGSSVFKFKVIETSSVYKQLRSLKTAKAIGLDGIPTKPLRDSATVIAPSITSLLNLSLATSSVPNDWKTAIIIPIYKGKSRNDPSNYKPILILSILYKILDIDGERCFLLGGGRGGG